MLKYWENKFDLKICILCIFKCYSFQSWEQGAGLVNVLSDLLEVPRDTFTDIG